MTKQAVFDGLIKAVASENHPGQQLLSFVFTDYKPNKNKQAVPREEADNIIRRGMHMPVKISFASRKAKGHLGAFPIGPILSLREENERIIGEAVVWKNEFPDVAAYLEKASAEDSGVHFSWELLYADSEIDADGNQWLHGIVPAGITIVDTPAYQGRTPLLAVAEEQVHMEELQKRVDELLAQVTTLTSAVAEKEKQIADLQSAVAEVQKERDALTTEAEELRTFKANAEKAQAEAQTLTSRKQKMAEAGVEMPEDLFAKRKEMFISMSDEAFAAYVDDLVAVARSKDNKASASANEKIIIPDPITGNTSAPTVKEMVSAMRSFRGSK